MGVAAGDKDRSGLDVCAQNCLVDSLIYYRPWQADQIDTRDGDLGIFAGHHQSLGQQRVLRTDVHAWVKTPTHRQTSRRRDVHRTNADPKP